jgi:DNA/RNA-binding domain of Phe-tRNA-synthetase-like protein
VTSLVFQGARMGMPSRKIEAVRDRVIAGARERVAAARDVRRIPTLAAFQSAFPELARGPKKSWLDDAFRAIARHDPFPVVNDIVDAARLLALHYAIPIASIDLGKARPPLLVEVAPHGMTAKVSQTATADLGGLPVVIDSGGPLASPFVDIQRAMPGRPTTSVVLLAFEADRAQRIDVEDLKARASNWLASLVGARLEDAITSESTVGT